MGLLLRAIAAISPYPNLEDMLFDLRDLRAKLIDKQPSPGAIVEARHLMYELESLDLPQLIEDFDFIGCVGGFEQVLTKLRELRMDLQYVLRRGVLEEEIGQKMVKCIDQLQFLSSKKELS